MPNDDFFTKCHLSYFYGHTASIRLFDWMPDKLYISIQYYLTMGQRMNWRHPSGFHEKMNWLKIHYRRPLLTQLVDKYAVRDYVAERIGKQYLVPLIGKWNLAEEIDFDSLPEKFVLKCNHGSHDVTICLDKQLLDRNRVRANYRRWLRRNLYPAYREWPYKNVEPCIICEQFIETRSDGGIPSDYKFTCFNGQVDSVMLCMERGTGDTKFYFFDRDWHLLRYNKRGLAAPADFTLPKPEGLDRMFELAAVLSEGFPFVRVDFYCEAGRIYFGEMTFYPQGGYDPNVLPSVDRQWGDKMNITF